MHMHNQIMNYNTKGRPLGPSRPGIRQPPRQGKPQHGRSGPGAPVDPDELSRRLHLVLADQKAYAERKKRAAKAEAAAAAAAASKSPPTNSKEASSSSASSPRGLVIRKSMSILDKAKRKTSRAALKDQLQQPPPHPEEDGEEEASGGPYVPREAAAQFALTTTAINMSGGGGGLAHKLSRNALKFHLEADHVDPNAPPAEQTKALRRAQSRREQLHERNQFQRSRILEEAAEVDEAQQSRNHRHTFTGALTGGLDHQQHQQHNQQNHKKNRRSSTGDLLECREKDYGDNRHALPLPPASPGLHEDSPPPKYHPLQDPAEHRVDWTQSDEAKPIQRARTVPLLKRRTSIFTLRGRFGSKDSKQSRGEKDVAIAGTIDEAPELSKPSRLGFLSRLRR